MRGSGSIPWFRPLHFLVVFPLGCWTSPAPQPASSRPAIPARFVDHPLGPGTCKWISIGEASEIIGQQLQYLAPDDNSYRCVLVPATGEGPNQLIANDAAWEARPNVSISHIGVAVDEWTPPAGIGEHSAWSGDAPFETLAFRVDSTALDIDVNLPHDQMPARAKERRALVEAIARKVYVRLSANPR